MAAGGYILDTEEIVKASWSLLQHDGAAAFQLSLRSPLPPALSVKDLLGGRSQRLTVRRIRRINCHPVETDEDSAPASIADTENWLNWNGDLHNATNSEDDCVADVESDIEQVNGIGDSECLEQRDLSAAANVSGLIRPLRKSMRLAEQVLVSAFVIAMRRNKRVKKK